MVRNGLRNMTRGLKKTFEKGLVAKLKDSPKSFWTYVNTKVKHTTGEETLRSGDGTLIETDKGKAEVLNSFFASVYTKEDLSVVPNLELDFDGEPLEDVVFTREEVIRRLEELDPAKSSGPNNLHPALLKGLSTELGSLLTVQQVPG